MTGDAVNRLLERQVVRPPSDPVAQQTINLWCEVFGSCWPECVTGGVPSVMVATFGRPSFSLNAGEVAVTGVVLHDELKAVLGLPIALAVGYEIEIAGAVQVGDELVSVEHIAAVGDERPTSLGLGREWVIEVATSTTTGNSVCVERFRMLGYRPGDRVAASTNVAPVDTAVQWSEKFDVTSDLIVRAASANRVWAPAHHQRDSAIAAGLPDIILDTSSQIAMLASAAQQRHPSQQINSVALKMKRPILPGATVTVSGIEAENVTVVSATVDGQVVSTAVVSFAR